MAAAAAPAKGRRERTKRGRGRNLRPAHSRARGNPGSHHRSEFFGSGSPLSRGRTERDMHSRSLRIVPIEARADAAVLRTANELTARKPKQTRGGERSLRIAV